MLKKIIAIFFIFSLSLVSNSNADTLNTKISEYISNLIPGEGLTETSIKSLDVVLDYKKASLSKLREIVQSKGLVSDASKMKKNDILKVLDSQ